MPMYFQKTENALKRARGESTLARTWRLYLERPLSSLGRVYRGRQEGVGAGVSERCHPQQEAPTDVDDDARADHAALCGALC